MKNLVIFFCCLFVFANSFTANAQSDALKTETDFMNCVYISTDDEGEKFIKALNDAEKVLISKKYLKDGSGESYVALFKNIKELNDASLKDLGVLTYMKTIENNLTKEESAACMQSVFTAEAFQTSKLNKFLVFVQSLGSTNYTPDEMVSKILTILDPKDFKHNYYRMTTFTMIESMNGAR